MGSLILEHPWALKGYRCKGWSSPLTEGRGGGQEGNAGRLFYIMKGRGELVTGLRNDRTVGAKVE